MIENGGHGGTAAAPAAAEVFASYFDVKVKHNDPRASPIDRHHATDARVRRITAAGLQRAPRRGRRARQHPALARLAARRRRRRARRRRPLGGRPASRASTWRRSELLPQAADRLRRVGGRRARRRRSSSTPTSTAGTGAPIFIGTVWLIVIVLVLGRAARGSTRWIDLGFFTFQPSEFGKLLFVLAIAGFLAERARGGGRRRDDAARARARRDPRRARLRAARPRHRARLHRGARRDALRRGTPWRQLAVLGRSRCSRPSPCSGPGPAVGVNFLKRTRSRGSPASCIRRQCTVDARYNLEQSIAAVGSGEFHGRGAEERDADAPQLPARARHRLRLRVVQRAARLRRRVGAARALPARPLARRCASSPSRAISTRAIVAGGIVVALLFQIFVNVGMTMGIAPITGIPLAVRERRRLVDDREPRRDGRAARDPRARPRRALVPTALMACRSASGVLRALLKEVSVRRTGQAARRRRGARARRRAAARARPRREARRGPERRRARRRGRARLPARARADARGRGGAAAGAPRPGAGRRARAATPTEPIPYVLATDVVAVGAGAGFPIEELARTIAARLGEDAAPLAARCRCCAARSPSG